MPDTITLNPVDTCEQALQVIKDVTNNKPGADDVLDQVFAELDFVNGKTPADALAFLRVSEALQSAGIALYRNGDAKDCHDLFEAGYTLLCKAIISLQTGGKSIE